MFDPRVPAAGDGLDGTPGFILPRCYPLQLTEEFQNTFCQEPEAPPPAAVRTDFWKALDGRRLREQQLAKADAEAQERYDRARADYRLACDAIRQARRQVRCDNASIQQRNLAAAARYEQEQTAYRDALGRYQQRFNETRLEKLKVRLRRRLEWTIARQEPLLTAIHRESIDSARRETLQSKALVYWVLSLLAYAGVSFAYPLAAFVPALLAFCSWRSLLDQHRQWLHQATLDLYATPGFFSYYEHSLRRVPQATYTPVHFHRLENKLPYHAFYREACPFPAPQQQGSQLPLAYPIVLLLLCIPYVSAVVLAWTLVEFRRRLAALDDAQRICKAKQRRRTELLAAFEAELQKQRVIDYLRRREKMPAPPVRPVDEPLRPMPSAALPPRPTKTVFLPPEPQPPAYDDGSSESDARILRGAMVHEAKEVTRRAQHLIYSARQLRAFYTFGRIPIPLADGQSTHLLLMGTSGAGKSTILYHLMSALLPLTRGQAERIVRQSPHIEERVPATFHEWSRSFTYQAVVYNAKDEFIPALAALGFDLDSDLIILDPADQRCFAWDVSRDINTRRKIRQFANLLVPSAKSAESKKHDAEFWDRLARRMIKAIIVSLRNAQFAQGIAEPSWSLRDLVNAVETRESLYEVLGHHDRPERMRSQLVNLEGPQADSIYLSATNYISQFEEAAECWDEARRRGRTFSFSHWAKHQPGTVLVLPNTQADDDVNEPLNRVAFKALSNTVLTDEYTSFKDNEGRRHVKKRLIFVDELGQAGRLPDLERLMSEGRSFGAYVVLGVHQLSQLRETYGNNGAETIPGLCSYMALLRNGDPTTVEWMSKRMGDTLRAYDKTSTAVGVADGTTTQQTTGNTTTETHGSTKSHSEGKSEGVTDTKGTGKSGVKGSSAQHPDTHSSNESHADNRSTSEQDTEGTSEQHSLAKSSTSASGTTHTDSTTNTRSQDLRQEMAVFQSEIQRLPDPTLTGEISGFFITPSFPLWRADIPFAMLAPRYENPDALEEVEKTVSWDDEECVTRLKPWTDEDYRRLGMQVPQKKDKKRYSKQSPGQKSSSGDGELPNAFDF